MSSGSPGSDVSAEGADTVLRPLTPAYNEGEHGVYLRHLRRALTGEDHNVIHNIALMGGYGVGKSSILQRLKEELGDTAVTLSLPTLGEAAVPTDEAPGAKPVATSITNRIQKEIVKQLLYRERPERVPSSRFRRRTVFNWRRGIATSSLAATVLMVVLYLTHGADRLADLIGHGLLERGLGYVILLLLSLVIFTELQRAFHDQARIQQLVAGPASVTLAATSDSYFDEWLDEIVYFFEATKVDVLIFEDIDRFDDPHIFETLRELNTILNNSKQLDGRNVRFIYAIKDSIFEQLGLTPATESERVDAAEAEVWRANRTKFFDLVIPVVPFITHRSARDLMSRQLQAWHLSVSRELVDVVARHVADMRLIKNTCNEFIVFREKLLGTAGIPGLSEDQLFAMMLYKNVHLSDFELIRTGTSKLDALYLDSRTIVGVAMEALNRRARRLRQIIADPDPLASRSQRLGDALETYIDQVVRRHRRYPNNQISMQRNGRPVSPQDLRTSSFWREFLHDGSQLQVHIHPYANDLFYFSAGNIGSGIGEDLSLDRWKAHDVEAAERGLAGVEEDRALLVRADMRNLYDRPDFKLGAEGGERSFAEIAGLALGSQLATDLVANGYIDRNFTLYVSQYYSVHVSSQAMNFILHNVQPNVMDPYFNLDSSADVEAVLRESGLEILDDRSSYNLSILNHLIEYPRHDANADPIIRRLVTWGQDEQEFVHAYVAGGKHAAELIRRLSGVWPRTLPLAVHELDVDERERVGLVDAALLGADPAEVVVPDDSTKTYIERNYQQLAALTDTSVTSGAERTVSVLDALGVILPTIAPLSDGIRGEVIERSLYMLSKDNLVSATGGRADLALDYLEAASKSVYAYVLDNLQTYVVIVTEETTPPCTIEALDRFAAVLENVADHDPAVLPMIVKYAGPGCHVNELADINSVTWPGLAGDRRFPLTLANVRAYVGQYGVDANLAVGLLADPQIMGVGTDCRTEAEDLAVKILAAGDSLPDPKTRVQIVQSLGTLGPVEVDRINWENGKLAGLLVEARIVDDTEAVYGAVAAADWETKEFLISKSANFTQYIKSELLPAADLRQLLESKLVADAVKRSLLSRIKLFAAPINGRALQAAADFAVRTSVPLDADTLLLLAEAKVGATTIVSLLPGVLIDIPLETLQAMLEEMGGQYERLAAPGYRQAKLPNDPAHGALLAHLKAVGDISTFGLSPDGKTIKVNMKRPQ